MPTVVGWIAAAVAAWFGAVIGIRAYAQARRARAEERQVELIREALDEESGIDA
jgi:hypothetical protein